MTHIKVLAEHLINQIAAGEVVERPASVVKELVENSLDAGATQVIIELEGSGETMMRITDNGSGMDREDAQLAFERHATSKILGPDDLLQILSFGFRGEAIASIASVSKMSLQTKLKDAMEGTMVGGAAGGDEGGSGGLKVEAVGCPVGTQITVRDLFFNTPARQKYLKNAATEYGHILDTVTAMALAAPEVGFKLVRDGRVVFDLPATEDALTRIRGLLGRDTAAALIPVFNGHSAMKLSGFIGKPDVARSNRKGQWIFVNGRAVSSHVLSYAVKQAYHSLLSKEKHPVFVLFLEVDPQLVDVNVHPRKLEVRFVNERDIFKIFVQACEAALEKHVLAPDFSGGDDREQQGLMLRDAPPVAERDHYILEGVEQRKGRDEVLPEPAARVWTPLFAGEAAAAVESAVSSAPTAVLREEMAELKPLAQMDSSYILCEQGAALVIVDQHAAHERIRYTDLLDDFERRAVTSQPLLMPENIELAPREALLLEENMELFTQLGFDIAPFGGNTFAITAVPSSLTDQDSAAMVKGLLDDISDQTLKGDFQKRKERALTFAACRSAVKFGDPLSQQEMEAICKNLMELKLPYTCPHGRPTMVTLTQDELKKRFGRDYRG